MGVDTVPISRPRYGSENSLQQRVGGVEVDLRYKFRKHWSIENNVPATTIKNKSSRPEYQGNNGGGPNNVGQGRYGASYVPPYIYNGIVNFKRNRIYANLTYQYTAAHVWQWPAWSPTTGKDAFLLKPVPAFGVVNANVGIDITKNLRWALEGYNLLDNRHTEWRGDESYFGRALWVRMNINIDSTLFKRASPR